jgi:hypothetical protein
MTKCDLDLGGRGLVVAHDTSSYYNKHLCQVISDSFNDKVMDRTRKCDRRTDGQTVGAYYYIPLFSSKRRGGHKKQIVRVIKLDTQTKMYCNFNNFHILIAKFNRHSKQKQVTNSVIASLRPRLFKIQGQR